MYKLVTLLSLLIILVITGCYYDVEEELYPTLECSTDGVTYSNDILPIISNNCYGCHGVTVNSGNITVEGYANLKSLVDNNALIGAIKHEPGYSPMPKNAAQLIECDIEKIETWIANGALDD